MLLYPVHSFDNFYMDNNLIINNINSIYINETSELEIINIINTMDSKCSKDHDGIDFKLIKLVMYSIKNFTKFIYIHFEEINLTNKYENISNYSVS